MIVNIVSSVIFLKKCLCVELVTPILAAHAHCTTSQKKDTAVQHC
jgi:hypothetical protein